LRGKDISQEERLAAEEEALFYTLD
jgi:hypothetical protein